MKNKTVKRCECGGRLEAWEDKCPCCQFEDGVPASEIDGAVDSGCTCHLLPEFDMDGSLFSGRCRWCEKHEAQTTEDYDGDWPPGAPVYK